MKLRFITCLVVSAVSAIAADRATITVTQDLTIDRPSETIVVPWAEVARAIPGVLLQHLAVKDASGQVLAYQVTNLKPLDPNGAYGDLLFQHDFAAGEKSATFTIEKIAEVAPVFPSKAFARYVPERLDDFAWENDRIAHRTYGAALEAPAPPGSGKEVLWSSGLDVWSKRVKYLIVDRWYNKGHNHYHHDEGEGMDMYNVGPSRGCGGTGIWDGQKLAVSHNYKEWRVLANGPIRAIFELSFAPWDAAGVQVSEVKRFTVDAGHNLDQMDSIFTFSGPAEITVGVGLAKNSGDKGQDTKPTLASNEAAGWIAQWEVQKTNGSLGEAVIVPAPAFRGLADDASNHLVLAHARSGEALRYYVGAGWTKSGDFSSQADWNSYVASCAAIAASPVHVAVATAP